MPGPDITAYSCPPELVRLIADQTYVYWLEKRAQKLRARDLERCAVSKEVKVTDYYRAIDDAMKVCAGNKGTDFYTGEDINWGLLGKAADGVTRDGDHPSIDHIIPPKRGANLLKVPVFAICRDDTNKFKSDLSVEGVLEKLRQMTEVRGIMSTDQALNKARCVQPPANKTAETRTHIGSPADCARTGA